MVNRVGTSRDDTLRGKRGNDTIIGKEGNDHLYGGGGDDHIEGGPGNDWLKGNKGKDTITGDGGNDQIWGQGGADRLGGGPGDDVIRGGGGADTLFGDDGINQLYGGKGKDLFALSPDLPGSSTAVDFSYEQGDQILLDVDTNRNRHLDPAERELYLDLLNRLDFEVQGNETVVSFFPAGDALTAAAAGDDGPLLRLSEPIRGSQPGLSVYAYGANGEEQVPTNPSRSSDESQATFSPALSGTGRFLAVISQFDLDGTEPERSSSVDAFVIDQLTNHPARVNTGFDGGAGSFDEGQVGQVAISDDGRFVAFLDGAGDPQSGAFGEDVFVRDLLTDQIWQASDGIPAGDAVSLSLSADGRTIAFISDGEAFVSTPGGGAVRIQIPSEAAGISLAQDGSRAVLATDDARLFVADLGAAVPVVDFLADGENPDLSANGRFVAYRNPGSGQIVRREIDGTQSVIVSRGEDGDLGDAPSFDPSISADGRFVAFGTAADNLVPNDTNRLLDVLVKDIDTGAIGRASIDTQGQQAFTGLSFGGRSYEPSISDDGQFVAYTTLSPNLQDPSDPELGFSNGRTVIWSPVDFDRVAQPDVRGDGQTETVLSVGGSIESDIAAFGDVDLVRIAFEANQLYEIAVAGDPVRPSNVGLPFFVLQGEGTESLDLLNGTAMYLSTEDEVLFGALGSNPEIVNGSDPNAEISELFLGDYQVALQPITDVPDDISSSATLAIGDPVRQAVEQAADRDWYRIELEADQSYRFRMRGASSESGSLSNPELELYDASGALQAIDRDDVLPDGNLDSVLEFTAPADGAYFVSAGAGDSATGTYTVSAAPIIDVPPILDPGPILAAVPAADLPPTG